jgi:hypothetical protein
MRAAANTNALSVKPRLLNFESGCDSSNSNDRSLPRSQNLEREAKQEWQSEKGSSGIAAIKRAMAKSW